MLAATFIALIANPKTFQELEVEKIRAYKTAPSFYEEIVVVSQMGKDPRQELRRNTWKNGNKWRVEVDTPAGKLEEITDGQTRWVVLHRAKEYYEGPQSADNDKPEDLLLTIEEDGFSFGMNPALPLLFAVKPDATLSPFTTEELDGKKVRKASATAKKDKSTITLTQWFDESRYFLRKLDITGETKEGPISLSATWKVLDLEPKIEAESFRLDPAKYPGFVKKSLDG
jgi:outer membrane lipoprotein-sorting protein